MSSLFTIQQIGPATVVEIHAVALMEQPLIDAIAEAISSQIVEQGKRKLIIDFTTVEYMSSRAINMVLVLKKKLADLPGAELILCGVGSRLSELVHITRLDKVLNIQPTQQDAIAAINT
jgi:anti-sigma B factor antagonist